MSCRVKGREELRLQVGTLRFDLDTLISNSGNKAAGKAAKAALFKEVIFAMCWWGGVCVETVFKGGLCVERWV